MVISTLLSAVLFPTCAYATNTLASRIAEIDPTVSLSRFSEYPPSKGRLGFPRCLWENPFPANGKFWLKDVDFSCASPWNDSTGPLRAGTLISKRHIVYAKHFPIEIGTRILFVDQEGEMCPRRVVAAKKLSQGDIMIGALDFEVSPNIHPARILPEDYAKYIGEGKGLPVVTFNQREQAFLSQIDYIRTNGISNVVASDCAWKKMGGELVSGDSGNPAFLLIGNEPILLYCLYAGGVGLGPSIYRFRHEIQRVMDELCPGYKLEVFDFKKIFSILKGTARGSGTTDRVASDRVSRRFRKVA